MTDLTHASRLDLGKALRARRKSLGWTRADLAAKLDLSDSEVTRMENTSIEIEVTRFVRWCTILGLQVEVNEMLTATKPMPAHVEVEDDGA